MLTWLGCEFVCGYEDGYDGWCREYPQCGRTYVSVGASNGSYD